MKTQGRLFAASWVVHEGINPPLSFAGPLQIDSS